MLKHRSQASVFINKKKLGLLSTCTRCTTPALINAAIFDKWKCLFFCRLLGKDYGFCLALRRWWTEVVQWPSTAISSLKESFLTLGERVFRQVLQSETWVWFFFAAAYFLRAADRWFFSLPLFSSHFSTTQKHGRPTKEWKVIHTHWPCVYRFRVKK